MMFAGGSPEAQKLVNQALAARAEAATAPPRARSARTRRCRSRRSPRRCRRGRPQATPPPVARPAGAEGPGPRRTHGAAIAATMVAMPAAGKIPGGMPGGGCPVADARWRDARWRDGAPSDPTAGPRRRRLRWLRRRGPATRWRPAPAKPTGAAAFRETLWFKQGDVDQMVADARAKLDALAPRRALPYRSPRFRRPTPSRSRIATATTAPSPWTIARSTRFAPAPPAPGSRPSAASFLATG